MTLHDNDHFSVEHAVQELPELAEFSMLLGAVRRYLGMQVVFTSRFSGTERSSSWLIRAHVQAGAI